jgi:hypothetical protein
MALRIGGGKPPVEEPIEEPVEEPVEEMVEEAPEAPMDMAMGGGQVDPMAARYFGPESRCGGCVHFLAGEMGSCEIVAGPIDAEGVCSLFTPDASEEVTEELPPLGEESPIE